MAGRSLRFSEVDKNQRVVHMLINYNPLHCLEFYRFQRNIRADKELKQVALRDI